jgi:hypothetical protein
MEASLIAAAAVVGAATLVGAGLRVVLAKAGRRMSPLLFPEP